jgi:arylsulfatase A-like enzyme
MRGLFTRNFRNYHHPKITKGNFNGARAIISGDYKLVIDGDKNTGIELFNIRNDIAESKNLAGSQPAMVEKLEKEMRDWQSSVLNSLMEADYESRVP